MPKFHGAASRCGFGKIILVYYNNTIINIALNKSEDFILIYIDILNYIIDYIIDYTID